MHIETYTSIILFQQSVLSHVKALAAGSGVSGDQFHLWEPKSLYGRPTVAIIWKSPKQRTVYAQHEMTKDQERLWNTEIASNADGSHRCAQVARKLIQKFYLA
jgi:hypothetical protein